MCRIITAIFCCLFIATFAFGAGVKDKKTWKAATNSVEDVKKDAEKACGAKFEFAFNQKTFKTADLENKSMGGWCGDVFGAIEDLCKDADYKPEVVKKVKSVTCTYKKDLKKVELKLAKGALEFAFNWDTGNHESEAKKWLEGNL